MCTFLKTKVSRAIHAVENSSALSIVALTAILVFAYGWRIMTSAVEAAQEIPEP